MIIQEANRITGIEEYYFSIKLKKIKDMEATGFRVINLGIGNPDLPPSQRTIEKLFESANRKENHGYQSYRSTRELRQAISLFYKKNYRVILNPDDEILPLIGSKEGIMHISMAFVNPGDKVLIPNPGYPAYTSVSKIVGADIECYNLIPDKNWLPDIDSLKSKDLSKVKLMWINYPNMPSGAVASKDNLAGLIDLARENNFLLCNDNPYSLVLNNSPVSLLSINGALDNCLELNSLSKSHNMAGWRIGWVAGNKELINSILKVKSNIDSGIFLPLQEAAVEALNNTDKWHKSRNEELRYRREKVFELLDSINCSYETSQAGMFVWARIPEEIPDVREFIDEILYNYGVFITPGIIFGSNGGRYVRISLCNKVEEIVEAINRIRKMKKAI